MKLSLEMHDTTYTIESIADPDVEQMATMFRGLLVNAGFHPSSVEALFDVHAIDSWNISTEKCPVDEHELTNQIV